MDLPQPTGPTRATVSPGRTLNSTPLSTWTVFPLRKLKCRFSTFRTGRSSSRRALPARRSSAPSISSVMDSSTSSGSTSGPSSKRAISASSSAAFSAIVVASMASSMEGGPWALILTLPSALGASGIGSNGGSMIELTIGRRSKLGAVTGASVSPGEGIATSGSMASSITVRGTAISTCVSRLLAPGPKGRMLLRDLLGLMGGVLPPWRTLEETLPMMGDVLSSTGTSTP